MSQTIRPTSTITNSNWTVTGASAHAVLADDSDASYDSWSIGGNLLEVKFGAPAATPAAGAGSLYARTFFSASLAYVVLQGVTTIQSGSVVSMSEDEITDHTITLTAENLATVTDWSDLRVQFTGSGFGGGNVYEAALILPDAAVSGGGLLLRGVG